MIYTFCDKCRKMTLHKCNQCEQNQSATEGSTDFKTKYQELIMAVCTKFPNETRHQTALRYIKAIENRPSKIGKNL